MSAKTAGSFLALVTVLALVLLSSPTRAGEEQQSQGKVAVVNGSAITQTDFDMEVNRVEQKLYNAGKFPAEPEIAKIEKQVLESLIDRELLYQESKKRGYKVEEEAVNEQLRTLQERFPSEKEFKNALSRMNLSEAGFKASLQRNMTVESFIDNQFVQNVNVSDQELRAYFDSHPDSFTVPEQVRASHILIKVETQADEAQEAEAHKKIEMVKQRLKKGEDFAALAREFSQGPSSSKGGDLGYLRRGQTVKPFEEAAFGLQPGEVSDVVETRYGYHLIKVTDKTAETSLSFGEVQDRLSQYLKQVKVEKEISDYVEKLKEKANIERLLKLD